MSFSNPKTGEILALASFPTFHPLEYDKVSPNVYNQNLPVSMSFEPGSTFKIITLAAALEEGKVDLEEDTFCNCGRGQATLLEAFWPWSTNISGSSSELMQPRIY